MHLRSAALKWVGLTLAVALVAAVSWHAWQSRWPPPWLRAVDPTGRSVPPPPADQRAKGLRPDRGASQSAATSSPPVPWRSIDVGATIVGLRPSPDSQVVAVDTSDRLDGRDIIEFRWLDSGRLVTRHVADTRYEYTTCMSFLPDGTAFVRAVYRTTEQRRQPDPPEAIEYWDWRTGRLLRTQRLPRNDRHPGQVIAMSADGTKALVVSRDDNTYMYIWDMHKTTILAHLPRMESLRRDWPLGYASDFGEAAFSPDGRFLAFCVNIDTEAGYEGGQCALFRADPWIRVLSIRVKPDDLAHSAGGVAFSADSRLLAIASGNAVLLRRSRDGAVTKTIRLPVANARGIAFSPAGRLLAVLRWDDSIVLWDLVKGVVTKSWQAPGHIHCFGISPDGKWLVGGGHDGVLWRWPMP